MPPTWKTTGHQAWRPPVPRVSIARIANLASGVPLDWQIHEGAIGIPVRASIIPFERFSGSFGFQRKGVPLGGAHIFRRFRITWPRENSVQPDIERFWLGHANQT